MSNPVDDLKRILKAIMLCEMMVDRMALNIVEKNVDKFIIIPIHSNEVIEVIAGDVPKDQVVKALAEAISILGFDCTLSVELNRDQVAPKGKVT